MTIWQLVVKGPPLSHLDIRATMPSCERFRARVPSAGDVVSLTGNVVAIMGGVIATLADNIVYHDRPPLIDAFDAGNF